MLLIGIVLYFVDKHIYNNEVFEQLKNIAYINELPFESESLNVEQSELKNFLNENLFKSILIALISLFLLSR